MNGTEDTETLPPLTKIGKNGEMELDNAKSYRDISLQNLLFAEGRSSQLADEFTRLEVQIATILIAFSGLFLGFFDTGKGAIVGFSNDAVFIIKLMYAVSLFLLILSLVLGLIHIKRKEKFWDEMINVRAFRFHKWRELINGSGTLKEAQAFHEGTTLGKDRIVHTPLWTWIIQTACLGVAFALLFVLFLVFLYR